MLLFAYARVLITAVSTAVRRFLKSSPFASMMLVGFVTKSIAPRSMASNVISASFVVSVLTMITVALIFSCCNFSNSSRPFIRGIFTSRTTPSYCVVFSRSYASSPSLQISVAWNLLSELIISQITLLMSAESSTTRIFFFMLNHPFLFLRAFRSSLKMNRIISSLTLLSFKMNSTLCSYFAGVTSSTFPLLITRPTIG